MNQGTPQRRAWARPRSRPVPEQRNARSGRRRGLAPVLTGLLLAALVAVSGCAGTAGAPSSPGPASPGAHTTSAPSTARSPAASSAAPVPVVRGPDPGPDDPAPAGRAAVRRGAGRQRAGFRHGERDPGVPLRLGQLHRHGHRGRRGRRRRQPGRAVAVLAPGDRRGPVLRGRQPGRRRGPGAAGPGVRHHAERRRAGNAGPRPSCSAWRGPGVRSSGPRGSTSTSPRSWTWCRPRTPPRTRRSGS